MNLHKSMQNMHVYVRVGRETYDRVREEDLHFTSNYREGVCMINRNYRVHTDNSPMPPPDPVPPDEGGDED